MEKKKDYFETIAEIIISLMVFTIAVGCILLFVFIDKSEIARNYLEKINNANTLAGLKLNVFLGISKIILATIGIATPIILVFLLIKKHRKHEMD
ncbi:hypothetical protein ACE01N_20105 [Saccharicrinis sp. FJH2]|uniref:hypothetical protein n=1 Tax=Saccharicrinis sp. FJH65 TaxID=3344659 RepID=UPI0035F30003